MWRECFGLTTWLICSLIALGSLTPPDLDWMNGVVEAVGLQLGEASGGILALDSDGVWSEGIFQHLTGHHVKDLLKTIAFDSGRPGRY